MKKIQLTTQNKEVIVDDEDYGYLNQWKWYISNGYAIRKEGTYPGKISIIRLHRIIINAPKDKQVDHINSNKLDNRKENLRLATNSQNQMNRKKSERCSSKYKGVYFNKDRNKWIAYINVKRKMKYLGIFEKEEDAAKEYNKAALTFFKEYAKLNIINKEQKENE